MKNVDLDLQVKGGKVTAKLHAQGIALDLAIDVEAAGGNPSAVWNQLAAVAMNLAQGLHQAGDMAAADMRAAARKKAKSRPRS
jgi:ribosomal protein S9